MTQPSRKGTAIETAAHSRDRSHFGNVGVGEGNSPSGNGRENLANLWRDLQFLRYRVDRRGHPDGDKGKVQPVREVQKLV